VKEIAEGEISAYSVALLFSGSANALREISIYIWRREASELSTRK
jgi:hypothetical protein